jgi:hypothetical protein
MPNHLRKRHHRDPAQLAKLMIDIASGEVDDPAPPPETPAREFARQGGLKGGRARANKPPERRAEMAKIAIRCPFRKSYPDVLVVQTGQDWDSDNDIGPLDHPTKMRPCLYRKSDSVIMVMKSAQAL